MTADRPRAPAPDVSRLFELLGLLYGSDDAAVNEWLNTPQRLFGNRVPLRMMETPEGYATLCDRLQAVVDGAYL